MHTTNAPTPTAADRFSSKLDMAFAMLNGAISNDEEMGPDNMRLMEYFFRSTLSAKGINPIIRRKILLDKLTAWCGENGKFFEDGYSHSFLKHFLGEEPQLCVELRFSEAEPEREQESLLNLSGLPFGNWYFSNNKSVPGSVSSPEEFVALFTELFPSGIIPPDDNAELSADLPMMLWILSTDEGTYYDTVGAGLSINLSGAHSYTVDGTKLVLNRAWLKPWLPEYFGDNQQAQQHYEYFHDFNGGHYGEVSNFHTVTIDFGSTPNQITIELEA